MFGAPSAGGPSTAKRLRQAANTSAGTLRPLPRVFSDFPAPCPRSRPIPPRPIPLPTREDPAGATQSKATATGRLFAHQPHVDLVDAHARRIGCVPQFHRQKRDVFSRVRAANGHFRGHVRRFTAHQRPPPADSRAFAFSGTFSSTKRFISDTRAAGVSRLKDSLLRSVRNREKPLPVLRTRRQQYIAKRRNRARQRQPAPPLAPGILAAGGLEQSGIIRRRIRP